MRVVSSPALHEREHNRGVWNSKPLLREIYHYFYKEIASRLHTGDVGMTVEIGSGIGAIREVIPNCITTDLVKGEGVDREENLYNLSFSESSVANLILFDVFHHLRYPAKALAEAARVLIPGGRIVMLEPCVSALGLVVYGVGHREPLGLTSGIVLSIPDKNEIRSDDYYAAQGNGYRVFVQKAFPMLLGGWRQVETKRFSSLSYVLSGGYRPWQLYPSQALSIVRRLDTLCDRLPGLFATRLLVVLEKATSEDISR